MILGFQHTDSTRTVHLTTCSELNGLNPLISSKSTVCFMPPPRKIIESLACAWVFYRPQNNLRKISRCTNKVKILGADNTLHPKIA